MRHEKIDLKVFVVVIPTKRMMGAHVPSNSEKKDGRFFWYDNDKDPKVCFLVTLVIIILGWPLKSKA